MKNERSSKIHLITGVPRSGTTLCCNLLNKCNNAVALHEPINPSSLKSSHPSAAIDEISSQIKGIIKALASSRSIEHGDKAGIHLDNPISLEKSKEGLRKQRAQRGQITLPPITESTQVFIKQNALFTALAADLNERYQMTAIVRNPVDVLLSWMTVDLPVNKGRLPAGEKYDANLAVLLKEGSVFERQMKIYRWFIECFQKAKVTTIRYEDIIKTNGNALYSVTGVKHDTFLSFPERSYPEQALDTIDSNWGIVQRLGYYAGYDKTLLEARRTDLFLKY